MRLKKAISVSLAALIMAGSFPAVFNTGGSIITVNAEESSIISAGDMVYKKYSDHVEVYSAGAATDEVIIESTVSGLPVTVIDEKAFEGAMVTAVIVPESVNQIKKDAFRNCSMLEEIEIRNKECTISDSAETICNTAASGGKGAKYSGIIRGHADSTAIAYALKYYYISRTIRDSQQTTSPASATTSNLNTTTTNTTSTTSKPATTSTTSKTTTTTSGSTSDVTTTTTSKKKPVEQGMPEFVLSRTEVYPDEANGKKVQFSISVEGADKLYCNTLIYVYFDNRLKVDNITGGEAIENLTSYGAVGDTGDFVVLSTSGSANLGRDGVMWTMDVTLPDNCEAGDEFVFVIGRSKYGKVQPVFTNFEYDENGKAMTEHIFNSGFIKGGVVVLEDNSYALGDVNNDGFVNAVDASLVLREYAMISIGKDTSFTDRKQLRASDVDCDGKIDSADASVILAYYANLSGSSPIYDITEFRKNK